MTRRRVAWAFMPFAAISELVVKSSMDQVPSSQSASAAAFDGNRQHFQVRLHDGDGGVVGRARVADLLHLLFDDDLVAVRAFFEGLALLEIAVALLLRDRALEMVRIGARD